MKSPVSACFNGTVSGDSISTVEACCATLAIECRLTGESNMTTALAIRLLLALSLSDIAHVVEILPCWPRSSSKRLTDSVAEAVDATIAG